MMKLFLGLLAVVASTSMAAACDPTPSLVLDKVAFQVSAKQWVTTQTALLSVDINATLTNADLVQARQDIMGRLETIAKGDWHLTQFNRSQDSSGLEKLYVHAQVRVPQATLTDVYQQAKTVSKPGATYTISTVEFNPSMEEIQQTKANIQEQLYKQINNEIARINKLYADQHYSVSNITFIEGDATLEQSYNARNMKVQMAMPMAAPTPLLTVSNELMMTAMVEVASNRKTGGLIQP